MLALVTVTGKLSDCPTTTSPKRKMVGLKVRVAVAAAGVSNAAAKSKAPTRKKTYFEIGWGRVITISV